jgi:hypothetical protein
MPDQVRHDEVRPIDALDAVGAVSAQAHRHPGLDPGSIFFNALESEGKVDAGSSPA